jgi:hypothetical protein
MERFFLREVSPSRISFWPLYGVLCGTGGAMRQGHGGADCTGLDRLPECGRTDMRQPAVRNTATGARCGLSLIPAVRVASVSAANPRFS